jgi:hypothetical protein
MRDDKVDRLGSKEHSPSIWPARIFIVQRHVNGVQQIRRLLALPADFGAHKIH